MESRLSSRLRILLGLMPMFGLTAMSCTIDPNADPNKPDIAVEDSDSEGADTSGVRSSDGTVSDGETAGGQGTGGNLVGTGETSGSSSGTQGGAGAETGSGSQGSGSESTGSMTTTDTTSDTDTECAKVEAEFTAVIPSIYLLVDRSGSMDETLPTAIGTIAGKRWDVVEKTLFEAGSSSDPKSGGVVYRMQEKAKFALSTYTSSKSQCPFMTYSEADDDLPKLSNWEHLRDEMDELAPYAGTPSAEGIGWVWRKIKKNSDANRILVFASDGDPTYERDSDCFSFEYPPGVVVSSNPQQRVVDVVRAMHADNIKTFVIGVGDGASDSHLDAVARAGVGVTSGMTKGSPGYPENPNEGGTDNQDYFFAGTDSTKLQKAFESIITGARPCKFQLEGELTASGTSGEVKIDGELKPYNDPNGWRINSATEIELLGESCKEIRSKADVDLKVSFSCGVFQPG